MIDSAFQKISHTNGRPLQFSGLKNKSKISKVFNTYDVNFDAVDIVFNALTKQVLPQQGAEWFLDMQEIGGEKYQTFMTQRIEGKSSIWDAISNESYQDLLTITKSLM